MVRELKDGTSEIGEIGENAGGRDGILKGEVAGAHEWSKQSVGDAESTGGSRGAQGHVVRELSEMDAIRTRVKLERSS